MKKTLVVILLSISIMSTLVMPLFAYDAETQSSQSIVNTSTEYILLDDGGYIKIELVVSDSPQTRASTFTKTGSKFVTNYDSDDNIIWQYTLTGSFLVESGVSATCTDSTYSTVSNSISWTFSNCSATRSGNEAFGVGTVKRKTLLLFVVETVDIDISIKCDVNGQLS